MNILAGYDLSIRQLFVTDPIYSEEPKLVMIIDGPLPHGWLKTFVSCPMLNGSFSDPRRTNHPLILAEQTIL